MRIASGVDHGLILSANGGVLSFGCAEGGRLGRLQQAEAELAIRDEPEHTQPASLSRLPGRGAGLPACEAGPLVSRRDLPVEPVDRPEPGSQQPPNMMESELTLPLQ